MKVRRDLISENIVSLMKLGHGDEKFHNEIL